MPTTPSRPVTQSNPFRGEITIECLRTPPLADASWAHSFVKPAIQIDTALLGYSDYFSYLFPDGYTPADGLPSVPISDGMDASPELLADMAAAIAVQRGYTVDAGGYAGTRALTLSIVGPGFTDNPENSMIGFQSPSPFSFGGDLASIMTSPNDAVVPYGAARHLSETWMHSAGSQYVASWWGRFWVAYKKACDARGAVPVWLVANQWRARPRPEFAVRYERLDPENPFDATSNPYIDVGNFGAVFNDPRAATAEMLPNETIRTLWGKASAQGVRWNADWEPDIGFLRWFNSRTIEIASYTWDKACYAKARSTFGLMFSCTRDHAIAQEQSPISLWDEITGINPAAASKMYESHASYSLDAIYPTVLKQPGQDDGQAYMQYHMENIDAVLAATPASRVALWITSPGQSMFKSTYYAPLLTYWNVVRYALQRGIRIFVHNVYNIDRSKENWASFNSLVGFMKTWYDAQIPTLDIERRYRVVRGTDDVTYSRI